ncbi:MAG TPA: type VI secretion system-associated protein TagF [Burkholderiales bacterium]
MTGLGSPLLRQTFPSGWYGKIPTTGDFVARRVPGAFCDAWGGWLQRALEGARSRLAHRWPDDYLDMPVWRFVLSPGLLTPEAWAGVMAPSGDSVGRHFPLTVASALPVRRLDALATLLAARPWFDDIEEALRAAMAHGARLVTLDAAIAARPFREEGLRYAGPQERMPEGFATFHLPGAAGRCAAAWLAEASGDLPAAVLACAELPPAEPFCAMMDGRWREHGWLPGGAP